MSDEKGMRSSRSATVSSENPLHHRDRGISHNTRERFQQLDLDFLLKEYKELAANDTVEEPEEKPTPEHLKETLWLEQTGLGSLAKKFAKGALITESDIESQTQGLSSKQKRAVKVKAQFLNETLSMKSKKSSKGDARSLFAPGVPEDEDPRVSDEAMKGFVESTNGPILYSDLSDVDLLQVQQLNMIELATLMEHIDGFRPIEQHAPKKKKKSKKKDDLFGMGLEALVERDRRMHPAAMESSDIPLFFTRIITFLETHGINEEGIFRKAGSAARIKQLRADCESALGDIHFDAINALPHDVAAILKQFLRDLPEPLLTSQYIEPFSKIQHLENPVYGLQLLVMLLPKVHRAVLKRLLDFFGEVAIRSDVNKMHVANIAVVFAPTLFYVRGGKGKQMLKEVEMQVTTASTLKRMIESRDSLWEVPADIFAQLRFVNNSRNSGRKASKPKHLKRLLGERKAGSKPDLKVSGDMMVKWVEDSKKSPPVVALISIIGITGNIVPDLEVTEETTCRDILERLESPAQYHLFELGGNIHRRRIGLDCRLAPILKINPGVTFMIMSSN